MIVVLVAPSGVGKSTLASGLYEALPQCSPLPSYTTRQSRASDEQHPGELSFISEQEFAMRRREGEFLWSVQPYRQPYWYGTRRADVVVALVRGISIALLTGDAPAILAGYTTALSLDKSVVYMYLMLEDMTELRRRLAHDATRTGIEPRLASAPFENAAVRTSMLGYHMLDATQSKRDVLAQAMDIIKTNKHLPIW